MAYLGKIVFGVFLTAIGLLAGKMIATAPEPTGHEHKPTPDGMCSCEVAALTPCESTGEPTVLPAQTLKNLGVEVREVERRKVYDRTHPVQATVVDRPLNKRPVVAPFGGFVTGVYAQTGDVVKAGTELVTIARDPVPRPQPQLTASLLDPVAENVHDATRVLRTGLSQLDVTRRELERIRPFVENSTIPRKTAIDLEYDVARHEEAAEIARSELRNHGLNAAEIASIEKGAMPPNTAHLWHRVLQRNGLWGSPGEKLLGSIPEAQRELPWTVAAVGELAAAGLLTEELAAFLAEVPGASTHFAEVAGLLLQGTPLGTVRLLSESGALEPRMSIRAPAPGAGSGPPDWDVETIAVRSGQRVEAGDVLVNLYDAREMWLRLQPVGQELSHVAKAIELGEALRARPLVPGSGPALDAVHLTRMALQSDDGNRGGLSHAVVRNVSMTCVEGSRCRTWQLRKGLRYLVEVPVDRFTDHFVLPAEAITSIGPTSIVFIQEGDSFRAQAVHLEYLDDRVAVIPDDGSIFAGDPVVHSGAFSLNLALQLTGSSTGVSEHGHAHQ